VNRPVEFCRFVAVIWPSSHALDEKLLMISTLAGNQFLKKTYSMYWSAGRHVMHVVASMSVLDFLHLSYYVSIACIILNFLSELYPFSCK
jgi:hypothetical protein